MNQNFYEILKINPNATQTEVRQSYRKLVLDLHPDRNPSPVATEEFMRVAEAYETIGNPEKRANYDKILSLNIQIDEARNRSNHSSAGSKPNPKPKKEQGYPKAKTESSSVDWSKTKTHTKSYHNDGPRTTDRDFSSKNSSSNSGDNSQNNSAKKKKNSGPESKLTPTDDLLRLTALFSRARYAEAEKLARKIIDKSPKQALPYVVIGDIHRMRGQYNDAVVMYSYAIQADPVNASYQRKHDEILKNLGNNPAMQVQMERSQLSAQNAVALSSLATLCAMAFVVMSKEPQTFTWPIINTWTIGLVSMMSISGIAIGASMSAAGLLDKLVYQYQSAAVSISPGLALSFLGAINFWVACGVYVFIGALQNVFNLSSSRLLSLVGIATILFSTAAAIHGEIDYLQTILWGGNVIYLSAILGWAIVDAMQHPF